MSIRVHPLLGQDEGNLESTQESLKLGVFTNLNLQYQSLTLQVLIERALALMAYQLSQKVEKK